MDEHAALAASRRAAAARAALARDARARYQPEEEEAANIGKGELLPDSGNNSQGGLPAWVDAGEAQEEATKKGEGGFLPESGKNPKGGLPDWVDADKATPGEAAQDPEPTPRLPTLRGPRRARCAGSQRL